MVGAKQIIVRHIPSSYANAFVKAHHYSGKVVANSKLHLGAFLGDKLHGVMSFGSPLDKRKVLGLVEGTKWNEMLELNRMAFDDKLPRNSESRCLAIAFRMIRKYAPQIKWVLSFADGTQCGDGTIYRAAGFVLTKIKPNTTMWAAPDGEVKSDLSLRLGLFTKGKPVCCRSVTNHMTKEQNGAASMKVFKQAGYKPLPGNQLRYIYLLDKRCKLTCDIIPFTKIDEMGAGMYKGEKVPRAKRHARVVK